MSPKMKILLVLQTQLAKMTLMKTKLPMITVVVTVLILTDIPSLPVNKDFILMLQFWRIMSPTRPKLKEMQNVQSIWQMLLQISGHNQRITPNAQNRTSQGKFLDG